MRILRLASLLLPALILAACSVDTTGLSAESAKKPKGNPAAAVTVTEYADLQCPACKSAHTLINAPLIEQYGSRVRFEFKHFPLTSIHPYAMEAAMASECAADQGKFWEFVDATYENQEQLTSGALRDWAKALALDEALFDRCLRSGIKRDAVTADQKGGEALGVNSTPSYFVNGQKVASNIATIGAAIEVAERQGSEAPL